MATGGGMESYASGSGGPQSSYQRGRSTLTSTASSTARKSKWSTVAGACKSGVLQFVGLKQTEEESLHWDMVRESIKATQVHPQPGEVDTDHGSMYDKGTGRNAPVYETTELRPDLLKVAYHGVSSLVRRRGKKPPPTVPEGITSFPDLDDAEEGEEEGREGVATPSEVGEEGADHSARLSQSPISSLSSIARNDEDFFGKDLNPRVVYEQWRGGEEGGTDSGRPHR